MSRRDNLLTRWIEARQGRERHYLTRFSIGATLFFAGVGLMLFAEQRIPPSLMQEVLTLVGLLLAGAGASLAASAYIILTLLRLFKHD